MSVPENERTRTAILRMLAKRAADATLCPSEAARALTDKDPAEHWRKAMPTVHAAVDGLLRDGVVRLTWKGERLDTRSGPYRIALANRAEEER